MVLPTVKPLQIVYFAATSNDFLTMSIGAESPNNNTP